MFPCRLLVFISLLLFCNFEVSSLKCYKYTEEQKGGQIMKSPRVAVDCGNVNFCWNFYREAGDLTKYIEENCANTTRVDMGVCEASGCRTEMEAKICCCNTDLCNSGSIQISGILAIIVPLTLYIFQ